MQCLPLFFVDPSRLLDNPERMQTATTPQSLSQLDSAEVSKKRQLGDSAVQEEEKNRKQVRLSDAAPTNDSAKMSGTSKPPPAAGENSIP